MSKGNEYIQPDEYVFMIVQPVNRKYKLVEHTEIPFLVFRRTQLTFVTHQDKVVEQANSDLVVNSPAPTNARPLGELDAIEEDVRGKNDSVQNWRVKEILDNNVKDGNFKFKIHWQGDHEPTWEPQKESP